MTQLSPKQKDRLIKLTMLNVVTADLRVAMAKTESLALQLTAAAESKDEARTRALLPQLKTAEANLLNLLNLAERCARHAGGDVT